MDCLHIQGTDNTPEVYLSKDNNTFYIKGKSIPKDGEAFYKSIIQWVEDYSANPNVKTVFDFHMDGMNLSSSKMILFILYKLKEIKDDGKQILVNWAHYEDDQDMIEVGEDYEFMVDVPFKFKSLEPSVIS